MEFIPLEKYTKKNAKKALKLEIKKVQNDHESSVKNTKRKKQINATKGQVIKKKGKETLALKKKKAIPKRKFSSSKNKKEDEDEIESNEENNDENKGEEENDIHDNQSEEAEKEDNEYIRFKKKCEELDSKKKNRLFLKLKKKIHSEAQIKELHPDIRSVIFPRKKNSRWCWAVFMSEEKAKAALAKLIKNKDIFVNKPNPHEKVIQKRKEKMKSVLLKKEAQKKLQKMWT